MEELGGGGGGGGRGYWWWAAASTAQIVLGIRSYRRGHAGDSHLMPFNAFIVASLFVGATASAAVAALRSSGIYSVEDMKEAGANVRTGLGVPPRAQDK
ncbi:hypothetical protein Vadar_005049 [Vaccinium darrowii]|uniref:Uncharacterized protein n=1 Tax=Vaccinium darrowii TaxID=229202 RepID=A0ACB7Y664_9ERIC|nr:hypothetical protein Vadar_005049 [Vaccinium darrowii]